MSKGLLFQFCVLTFCFQNWEGKTPLHIAAELGALGFCEVLIEKGALASEECSAPDPRLLDQPTENSQFWKPINFAGAVKASTLDSMSAPLEERTELVKYLLSETDSLPNEENALRDCHEKLEQHFPRLLPLFMRVEDETKYKEEYEHAQELFFKVRLLETSASAVFGFAHVIV